MNHDKEFYRIQKRLHNVLLYSNDKHEKHLAGKALQQMIFHSNA